MAKLKPFFIVLLLAAAAATTASAQSNTQWRDSLTVLSRQIELNPKSVELRLRKAAINLQLQQWQYAVEEYNLVLVNDPHNATALYFRAYANNNLRRYELAKNDYQDLLMLTPRNLEARLGLGYTLQKMGKKREALDEMNTLVEQHTDSAVAYAARAGLETELKQYDAAVFDWAEATRLSPTNAAYAASEADLLLKLGRKSEAKARLDAAVARGVARGLLREWYARCR